MFTTNDDDYDDDADDDDDDDDDETDGRSRFYEIPLIINVYLIHAYTFIN